MTGLRDRLGHAFVVAAELVTSRGLITASSGRELQAVARELAADPRIDVLSITDNPGGHAMLAPDTLGTDLVARGQEVVIHLACKDWNRNALESRAWKLGSEGFDNVLALSGDYPVAGHKGLAAPVFDIDSVGLIALLADMNEGLPDERRPATRLDRTDFFLGCVVTNHKRHEREVVPQYLKLRKKVAAGARFVINQIGWDVRKDDELLRFIRRDALDVQPLANVYLLSRSAARAFHRGTIPGVVVTDELLALAERHGGERGQGPRLLPRPRGEARRRGARPRLRRRVPRRAHARRDLRRDPRRAPPPTERTTGGASRGEIRFPFPDEFLFFEPDPDTGLSSDALSSSYVESTARRRTDLRVPLRTVSAGGCTTPSSREDAPLRPAGRAVYRGLDRGPRVVRRAAHGLEQAAKVTLFRCRDCGDCSLPEIAYVCPESMCAKNQRNGPCGGTRDGLCEVYDTECIWSQAYERRKAFGEADHCSTARWSSRTTPSRGRARGPTASSTATTMPVPVARKSRGAAARAAPRTFQTAACVRQPAAYDVRATSA